MSPEFTTLIPLATTRKVADAPSSPSQLTPGCSGRHVALKSPSPARRRAKVCPSGARTSMRCTSWTTRAKRLRRESGFFAFWKLGRTRWSCVWLGARWSLPCYCKSPRPKAEDFCNRAVVTLFESQYLGRGGREGVGVLRWVANGGAGLWVDWY